MTAPPTTAEILANLADLNRRADDHAPMEPALRDDIGTFTQRLADSLPDIDPAVAGRVLIHTADIYGMFATWGNRQPLSDEALTAVQVLGEVGQRLYLGDVHNHHNHNQQEG